MATIIFDLHNTLVLGSVRKLILHAYNKLPYEVIKNRYEEVAYGEKPESWFWEIFEGDTEQLKKDALDKVVVDPDISVVGDLKHKHKIVLFTRNVTEWANYIIKKHDLSLFFDKIFSTQTLKATKTDAETYKRILEDLGNPKDVWFVDDKLENLEAAEKAGIKGVWIQRGEKYATYEPNYTIHKLTELKEIIK